MQVKLLVGSAGSGFPRAGQGRCPADQVLQAPHAPVVARLAPLRLDELPAAGLVAPLRPPRTRAPKANRRHPGDRGNEHPDHGRTELALQRDEDTEGEIEPDAEDDRQGGYTASGVERNEADDQAAADDGRKDHGVDRVTALLRPVDVLQVEPERELVQGQAHPDPEEGGEDLDPRLARLEGEAEEPGNHHPHDSEHQVMDVEPARRDVPGPPGDLGADHPGAEADECEGEQHAGQQDQPGALVCGVERGAALDLEVDPGYQAGLARSLTGYAATAVLRLPVRRTFISGSTSSLRNSPV